MIISSEIENVEKVENFEEKVGKSGKSILRAFAWTRAKNTDSEESVRVRINKRQDSCNCFLNKIK
jgi:hypothetical protein